MKYFFSITTIFFISVESYSQDLFSNDFVITVPELGVLDTNVIHNFNDIHFCWVSTIEDPEAEIDIKVFNYSNGALLCTFTFNLNNIRSGDLDNPVWTLLPNLNLSNNCIFELSLTSLPHEILCRKTYFNLLVP